MDEHEQEYRLFMLKLADKAREIRQDFEKLSLENKMRVKNDMSYIAFLEWLNQMQNNKN